MMNQSNENYDFFKIDIKNVMPKKASFSISDYVKKYYLKTKNAFSRFVRFPLENIGFSVFLLCMAGLISLAIYLFSILLISNYRLSQFSKVQDINKYANVSMNEDSLKFNMAELSNYLKNNFEKHNVIYSKKENELIVEIKGSEYNCDIVVRHIYRKDEEGKLNYLMVDKQKINKDMIISKEKSKEMCNLAENKMTLVYKAMKID